MIRGLIYWPQMTNNIKNVVEQCETCHKYHSNNGKGAVLNHDIPNFSWGKLDVDLQKFAGKAYIIIVYYCSKYMDIALINCYYCNSGITV